jgi:tRNA 2-thiouridine synthesizing protein E
MRTIDTDVEGYLTDPSAWTENWAGQIAQAEQIEMTEEHWDVLRFMRAFFEEHQVPPTLAS